MNWFKSFWKALNTPMGQRTLFDDAVHALTPRAQQALTLARKEAERLQHNFVGTQHVLLGLIKQPGVAVNVLGNMGVDLEIVRLEIEKQAGKGPDPKIFGNIPYTPRVKKVMALAAKEATVLKHTYVGTEHILLGLLREADGVAGRILLSLGLNLEVTRQNILKELDPKPSPIDIGKRYDVYCREGDQEVIYRRALFKGVRTESLELEQSDGQTIFIARSAVIKFCESPAMPGSENPSTGST
jgi:hypothetical protein